MTISTSPIYSNIESSIRNLQATRQATQQHSWQHILQPFNTSQVFRQTSLLAIESQRYIKDIHIPDTPHQSLLQDLIAKVTMDLLQLARIATVIILFAYVPARCHAEDFSSIYFFGDSLSDVGNLNAVTLGILPGDAYYDGRFSNGPVYSELLADEFGLGPLRPSIRGGTGFAYGGGRTSGTSFFEGGLFIRDLDDQIDDLLADDVDADGLYVVFAGANDFVLGGQTNPAVPVRRIGNQLERLVGQGVQNILSINLPLLGETPRFSNDAERMNQLSSDFNSQLNAQLNQLGEAHADLNLHRFDLAHVMSNVVALDEQYGFSNVTDESIRELSADGYLFWDDVHPTTATHRLLATAIFSAFDPDALIGDFNFNDQIDKYDVDILGYQITSNDIRGEYDLDGSGSLDIEDVTWALQNAATQNGDIDLNGRVEFADFITLSRNFDRAGEEVRWSHGDLDLDLKVGFSDYLILARNFDSFRDPITSVPEPNAFGWLLLGLIAIIRRRCGCAQRAA